MTEELKNELKNKLEKLFPLIEGKMKTVFFTGREISKPQIARHEFNFIRRMYSPSLMVHHVVVPAHCSRYINAVPTIVEFFIYDGNENRLERYPTISNFCDEYKVFDDKHSKELKKLFNLMDMMVVELL